MAWRSYKKRITLPPVVVAIQRYFIDLDPVLTSHYLLTTQISEAGNFSIPFEFSTVDGAGILTILGQSASVLNAVYIDADVIKATINGIALAFTTPTVADGKLHSGVISRSGTTPTLTLDSVVYPEDTLTASTGTFVIDAYGVSNSTNYFNGILANIDGIALGLATGNVEGNATYINIPESNREQYTLVDGDWLGGELVVNGDFATDSDWDKFGTSTISGGVYNASGISAFGNIVSRSVGDTELNKSYLFGYEIVSNISGGGCRPRLQNALGTFKAGIGVHSEILTPTSQGTFEGLTANSPAFEGAIDNISVKRLIEVAS